MTTPTKASLSLEQRITDVLNNPNAGSTDLAELIGEAEAAAIIADEAAAAERARAMDLVLCSDPKSARYRILEFESARDRLQHVLPKLREKLTVATAADARDRWLLDYDRVEKQRDEAAAQFLQYQQHTQEIVAMFAAAAAVDVEVSRINGSAPDGVHQRLRHVELEARDLKAFSRDTPSLASTTELPDWSASNRKLWPPRSSVAASYAAMSSTPTYAGDRWSDPTEQARRRSEIEKQQAEIGGFYQRTTEAQEERLNREERERFGQQRGGPR